MSNSPSLIFLALINKCMVLHLMTSRMTSRQHGSICPNLMNNRILNVSWRLFWRKGRGPLTKKVTKLVAETQCPHGTYHTNIWQWTCSCPSYLVSRFFLCKHLVWIVNTQICNFKPQGDLAFFSTLHCNHVPPFYHITAIHHATTPLQAIPEIPQTHLQALLMEMSGPIQLQVDVNVGIGESVGGIGTIIGEEWDKLANNENVEYVWVMIMMVMV